MRTLTVAVILLLVMVGINLGHEAMAQDDGHRTVAEKTEKKDTETPAFKDFQSRLTATGSVFGPFNIMVSPSHKGEHGFRYIDVPYIQFIGNSVIMFPSGKRDRFGNPWYIYASNFTLECHPRTNPAERRK